MICAVCSDLRAATRRLICVVEEVGALWAMERSGAFRGRYHVLGGLLSALDGVGPESLRIGSLVERVRGEAVREVVLALPATVDGQTTAHYVVDRLKITQVADLITLRDRLAQEAADAAARAKAEADRRGAVETKLAASNADAADLRAKLGTIEHALQLSEGSAQNKDVQITNLNNRLNSALAQKVEELQRYRSDFFGRMREVMANRPGIQVVGDRFVFQSEVLFPSGSAELSSAGHDQLAVLAGTLADLAKQIPADVPWVLRVDGHADRQSVDPTGPFVDNLDLSAKRALNVVKLLAQDGVPANRLAATAFGDTQPLDPAATPEAYAKNRRIEIRLTDR